MTGIEILLGDSRGVFIPRDFIDCYDVNVWNLDENDKDVQALRDGPDNEWYWDAWDSVLNKAKHVDKNGYVWFLHQEGDLFAYCKDLMTDDEYADFFGESRDLDNKEQALWYDTSAELY